MSQAKSVGIPSVNPPSTTCDDKNCPYHGSLRVRGMVFEGVLLKLRANKTGVFERDYVIYNSKYKRYERRKSKIHVHVPPCVNVKEGDKVIIGECRPVAKSVAFVVLGKVGG
ncbi:MAG: 30S ribosomal protein S17 [Candidatus Aramenus sulfurataquae]|jgi:small subunit ribosomal protein S17|uniref:Small ribosomal subunit protein uS17 n=3 Tax=Candidatus Aramenus sulfurataquae TaxID=1326980 RepID=A0A075DMX8_9CREN|nr:30S ribosomal protein S17P [Candidatus Aramenus sulfurataquae]MCL7343308.1 30S ribosomal protein S17 [Candidatus Aramenus sulfurataquae]